MRRWSFDVDTFHRKNKNDARIASMPKCLLTLKTNKKETPSLYALIVLHNLCHCTTSGQNQDGGWDQPSENVKIYALWAI